MRCAAVRERVGGQILLGVAPLDHIHERDLLVLPHQLVLKRREEGGVEVEAQADMDVEVEAALLACSASPPASASSTYRSTNPGCSSHESGARRGTEAPPPPPPPPPAAPPRSGVASFVYENQPTAAGVKAARAAEAEKRTSTRAFSSGDRAEISAYGTAACMVKPWHDGRTSHLPAGDARR